MIETTTSSIFPRRAEVRAFAPAVERDEDLPSPAGGRGQGEGGDHPPLSSDRRAEQ